ncbi:MAG: hypothetical protein CVU46_00310 [Chloroflexi bacterium HGW-Chloroflexi-8]|nr:MAG: hypothetical protein CVU46_00310 [Chloroflexi bacterium HGW-Chloroflexi-8]
MKKNNKRILISILFLLITTIIAYFGKMNKLGFYSDDWYLLYGGVNFGAIRYFDMFSIDRPFRGFLQSLLFNLFDINITYYYLLAILVRFAGALSLFWLMLILWKDKILSATIVAVIFIIYPGFLEQPNAMDYMAHQIALTCMILSIVFSIKYFNRNFYLKSFYFVLSTIFALICYFLMEYFIAMEGYRFLFIFFYLWDKKDDQIAKKLFRILLSIIPFLIAPAIFAYWRLFIFTSTRVTTSVELLLSNFSESIILSIITVLKRFTADLVETFIGAYTTPISLLIPKLGGKEFIAAILLGLASVCCFLIYLKIVYNSKDGDIIENSGKKSLTFALLAFLGASVCLFSVNLVERDVSYLFFNRFSFPSALGVSIFIVGFVSLISNKKIQVLFFSAIIFISVMTQFSNNVRFADEWALTQKFWQNFIWRTPNLMNGTTLVGLRSSPIYEGYYIWSPANLIYRATPSQRITISAEVLNNGIVKDIEMKAPYEKELRSLKIEHDYNKTLVFTLPTEKSCLRIIDNQQIELSIFDDELIQLASPYSSIDLITSDNAINYEAFTRLFRTAVSEDNWCYYYEQASLARQFGEWEKVKEIGTLVESKNLHPSDNIELMPFIQAYAYAGEIDKADELIDKLIQIPFYQKQACDIFTAKTDDDKENFKNGNELLKKAFCNSD